MTQPRTPETRGTPEPSDTTSEVGCCGRHGAVARSATRRALFGGVAAVAAVPVLAACGSGSESASDSDSGSGGSDGSAGTADGIATSDVPVGSGTIFEDQELVVTQPTEGEFKAFSSICTHRGCPVTQVDEDGITCTCHGSVFSLEDGSPIDGPADEPLPERTVTVEGETLTVT